MNKQRLEALTDGVVAIILTLMVLEIKPPKTNEMTEYILFFYNIFAYLISFLYVGIYWNNHHHMFHLVEKINWKVLWGNLFFLFSLSFIPLATSWIVVGQFDNHISVAFYGLILLLNAFSYIVLSRVIPKSNVKYVKYSKLLKEETYRKDIISLIGYFMGTILSLFLPFVSLFIYLIIALMWLIPDKRIEKMLEE